MLELGAEWVHGERGNVSYNLASPHNLLGTSKMLHDSLNWIFVDSGGQIVPRNESAQLLDLYHDISINLPDDLKDFKGSYGEFFTTE